MKLLQGRTLNEIYEELKKDLKPLRIAYWMRRNDAIHCVHLF
jgi:hypothetical protein